MATERNQNFDENPLLKTEDILNPIALQMADEEADLSREAIEALIDPVAQLIPAGHIRGLIFSGLARLLGSSADEKRPFMWRSLRRVRRLVIYLFVFALPAALIGMYQGMLRLVGRRVANAFRDGTWQFYVDYALREDTARHTNETHGFDTAVKQQGIVLDDVDRMTAWAMTAIQTLHEYDALLKNEWRERVYSRVLVELSDDLGHRARYEDVFRVWQRHHLPYRRRADVRSEESYATYRHRKFNEYFINHLNSLTAAQQRQWLTQVNRLKARDLSAYQHQLSILSSLVSDSHIERHKRLSLQQAHIALIYQGRYYLIPACKRDSDQMVEMETVRQQIATLAFHTAPHPPTRLRQFASLRRSEWLNLRAELPEAFTDDLRRLQLAPIVLNFDTRPDNVSLSELRQAERGIGDHPLTIFDTGQTFVFDQSHIFFDGAWGAALAEIMTNEAWTWTRLLKLLPPARPGKERPYAPPYQLSSQQQQRIQRLNLKQVTTETAAENTDVDLQALQTLRRYLQERSQWLHLTINDFLVLYRAIHAITYQPDETLFHELEQLKGERRTRWAAKTALNELATRSKHPAILLPVDATPYNPRDRVYPISFEVPLAELDLLNLHRDTLAAWDDPQFASIQVRYLTALAGFGQVMRRAKHIASTGESFSVGTIKLLAYMPPTLQQWLNTIPMHFDVLNDLIKGREVFSNIGQVAPLSTLTRFITAKDDNDQKTLVWGVMTDATGTMHISLRDFRPHVGQLTDIGQGDLAQRLTQHYLDSYVQGFNTYIAELQQIMLYSTELKSEREA